MNNNNPLWRAPKLASKFKCKEMEVAEWLKNTQVLLRDRALKKSRYVSN